MKIYDCFPLFNELDLLHIRLELLYDHVDHFIISECDSTFSGLDKPFNFEENKQRYSKYLDKIIYLKNYNTKDIENIINPYNGIKYEIFNNILHYYNIAKNSALTDFGKPHWCRDFIHKEYIQLAMCDCNEDDIIIFSDLDEIPDPTKFIFNENIYAMQQKNMTYYINKENISQSWYGSIILHYKHIKNNSIQKLRGDRFNYNIIENGGWHLTNMGGVNRITEKIKSYGHQEFNNNNIIKNLNYKILNNCDIFNRNIIIRDIDIDTYYPKHMYTFIKEKYNYLIYNMI